jgi:DNA mismatch repair protein MutS
VGPGAADRSYGIQVARLAGLPEPVINRAKQVLDVLEQRSAGTASSSQKASVLDDLPLFAHQPAPTPKSKDPIHEALDAVRPDDMTPKQAIEALYELKKLRDDARRR